jgi:hypothetical protein
MGFPAGEPGRGDQPADRPRDPARRRPRRALRARAGLGGDGRSEGLDGSLAGLSGGPALDAGGRILGVTIAESPRRGRIYTTAPDSLNPLLDRAGVEPPPGPGEREITPSNYGRVADDLREDLRIAMVVCLAV